MKSDSQKMVVDAVTIEIVGNLLLSIAEETGVIIIKSAYSTNIKERRDISTAIIDPDGNMVAQAEHMPVHLGSLLGVVKEIYKKFPKDTVKPGEMFVVNDPYNGGGNHLPDIVVAAPAFSGAKMIGWVANVAHHSDIGGKVAGSTSGDSVSIFQEGIKIPIVKICKNSEIDHDILDILLANTRVPHERYGDFTAQVAANKIGICRLEEAYCKYGDCLIDCMKELQNYAERRLRSAIAAMPDGEYTFTDYMDNGGAAYPDPLQITVKVTIKDDFMDFDFTGTVNQIEAPINVPFSSLLATVFYSLKALAGPDIPSNAGIYKAFRVNAPQGTLINPVNPAPVGLMMDTCQRLPDVIFGALAPVTPERIVAGCNGACTTAIFIGNDSSNKDNYFIYHDVVAGGSGASRHADGLSGVQVHMTNSSNMPVEALEVEFPIITIKKYKLRRDSGGAGRFRGGLGIEREFEIMADNIRFNGFGDRQKFQPWGLEGGCNGAAGAFFHRGSDGRETKLPNKCTNYPVKKGDTITVLSPGSGGYGDPVQRTAEKVLEDVVEEKVSLENAREQYKVAISAGDHKNYRIDAALTAKLRQSKPKGDRA
jgi:N-methylhydantoinase B